MNTTPEQIATELDQLAEIEVIGAWYDDFRAAAALIRAQSERVRVLEEALTEIGHSLVCAPTDRAEHNASELLRAGNIARAALNALPPRDEEDDTILRLSSINEHGEAPDGSVWRNIVINGEEYTIPYEVAMWFVHRGNERDASRALLRDALSALEPFAKGADRHDETVQHTAQEQHYLPYGLQQIDLRRARTAADKIRAALTQEKK